MKISHQMSSMKGSPIRKIVAMIERAKTNEKLISFAGGAPSLAPPREMMDELNKAFAANAYKATSYTSTRGMPALISDLCEDIKKTEGLHYSEDQLMITEGSTEGLFATFYGIFDKGDEVIIFDPTYVGYSEPLELLGAKVVRVKTPMSAGFQPDHEELKNAVTKKTQAILIVSPDNPTGRILSEESTHLLSDLAKDAGLWIINDRAYNDIYFEEPGPVPTAKYAYDNTISSYTFSKSASSPGIRIGYLAGPKEIISAAIKVKQYLSLCSNSWGQIAARAFLKIKEQYIRDVVIPAYRKRRDVMIDSLRTYLPDAKFMKPQGAMYVFPDFSTYIDDRDEELVQEDLLESKNVAVVPGKFFGENGAGHFRLTYVAETEEKIVEGTQRMAEYFNEFKSEHLPADALKPGDTSPFC